MQPAPGAAGQDHSLQDVRDCRRRGRPEGGGAGHGADLAGEAPFIHQMLCQTAAMPSAWPRTILHVDLDAFYTSVHQRDDDSLRGRPVAVAGSSKRSVVMGASYEARAFGVRSAMPLHEALALCPDLVVIRPAMAQYREVSRQIHGILRRFASPEKIEGIALDEAYLDVTARTRGNTTPEEVARQVKFMIRTDLHLTASVGVAVSKLVAKIGSASRKPDGLVIVPPDTEADFMAGMPIGVIPGIGPKTEERLTRMGLRRVGDLAGYDTQRLVQALGSGGAVLQRLAQGRDRTPVDGSKPLKTISAETTFESDISDRGLIEDAIRELTDRLAQRLREQGVKAKTVYVKVKLPDFRLVSRQVSRTSATDDADAIFRAAKSALEKSHLENRPVRLIGVGLSGLEHPQPELQMSLFD
ncbi:MAG: DNA polymerase IV [Candidatus Dormibacteraceae bacterium]